MERGWIRGGQGGGSVVECSVVRKEEENAGGLRVV